MTEETISDTTGTEPETIITEPTQDPIEQELERETKKEGKSEAEKAAFSLKKNLERAKELGVDVDEVLGIKATPVDKDTPLTIALYEQMQREQGQKTSIQLAEGITDDKERELVVHYLKTRIVPSGDSEDDLRLARHAVNSIKNGMIAEEMGRANAPRAFSSGAGAPARTVEKEPELTPAEQLFTKAPFNMTATEIISKRTPQ